MLNRGCATVVVLVLMMATVHCGPSGGTDGAEAGDIAEAPDAEATGDGDGQTQPDDPPRWRWDASTGGDDTDPGRTVGEGGFGSPCSSNTDCFSGFCVPSPDGFVCSKNCDASCPEDWSCVGIQGEGDLAFVCLPNASRLCEPCLADSQCAGGYCLSQDDGQACSLPCPKGDECPEGYVCEERTSELDPLLQSQQCVPVSGVCDCTASDQGETRPCEEANDEGAC